jgi:hypothetical protein
MADKSPLARLHFGREDAERDATEDGLLLCGGVLNQELASDPGRHRGTELKHSSGPFAGAKQVRSAVPGGVTVMGV